MIASDSDRNDFLYNYVADFLLEPDKQKHFRETMDRIPDYTLDILEGLKKDFEKTKK